MAYGYAYITRNELGVEVVSREEDCPELPRGTEVEVIWLGDYIGNHLIKVKGTDQSYQAIIVNTYEKTHENTGEGTYYSVQRG
ncbi:hypothetical protein [Deinococcus sp.]|uniref:hypothetical protein n=1 Tax=Deinococcus sp. TaxID=47478 RepID=UPI003C7C1826